jgi:protoporphyrinogen oxidase
MARIVILGAGLTGLSAAYHLEKHGFFDYKLFEKDATVGGLCRSIMQDGFTFDYTGHLLHINDSYFLEFINSVTTFDNFNHIERRSFVYSQNTYTRYPYQTNLYGLPAQTIIECIEGFITRKKLRKKPKTFYTWVLQNFGAGIGRYFFFPYQEKIFNYSVKKLSASWTGRFVPQTSLSALIKGAINDTYTPVGYNAQFFYPKQGGIYHLVAKIAEHLKNPIYTEHQVKSIHTKEKKVIFTSGASESFEYLINTIPLTVLLQSIQEKSHTNLQAAISKLLCNSVVNFNLGINRPDLSDKHWIYYPEKIYPFYRIGFPHNFSSAMTPTGCSSLYGEFSHFKKSHVYIEQQLHVALKETKKLFAIEEREVLTERVIHIPYAYVIYNSWRDKNLNAILEQLQQEYNIYSTGRYGAWKYASMQEAVLDGQTAAERFLS